MRFILFDQGTLWFNPPAQSSLTLCSIDFMPLKTKIRSMGKEEHQNETPSLCEVKASDLPTDIRHPSANVVIDTLK